MAQFLTLGALILVAFFTITAAVIVIAPYVAVAAIVWGIGWSVMQEAKPPAAQK